MILLTGATGFLGSHLARELLRRGCRIAALVRSPPGCAAARLARAWWDAPDLAAYIGTAVWPCSGDVTVDGLGLAQDDAARLVETTHVIHAAADVRLHAPVEELLRTNRDGTARVLQFARTLPHLRRLVHVSTAYVAGNRPRLAREDDLSDEWGFRSPYELSKFEAERLAREASGSIRLTIVRPGMIVGDSRTGAVKTFNTVYFPLRLYLSGKIRVVAVSPSLRLPLVPVDYVAGAVVTLLDDPAAAGRTVHLLPPHASCPTAGELVSFVRSWARESLDVSLPRPVFAPLPLPRRLLRYRPGRRPPGRRGALLPYSRGIAFDREQADRLLGPYSLEWRRFMPSLLRFAVDKGFLHRSDRTVHEQVLFRLGGRSRPIRYHDIASGRIMTRAGDEVRREIEAATRGLAARGIGVGDRVAVIGQNSSRYLAVDVAIGCAGAVSVPLYPSTPVDELRRLIASSGAALAFVGDPVPAGEASLGVPVISFHREPVADTVPWEAFIESGHGAAPSPPVIGPDDPATIRHTSGTTGTPQPVVFDHRNLRWMAECMASLLPWRARTRPGRALSWLPMSHVVEGILATYAPYYLPAAVDIFFLADHRALAHALPVAHPTVFFSVPRVYEKLWQALRESPGGRMYLAHPGFRRLARPIVRRALLRRAGLDGSRYLIVGSAPSDPGLLESFRSLGIEIHNAYGLTEAPLLTLNRIGANRIGTVGPPLPDTEIALVDGEILVRGPQVARTAPTNEAGWLPTGDLGHFTPEGYLVIDGRCKEIIATSYGKKIALGAVEAALRGVPRVAQAMLLGECRPHCIALLWTERALAEEELAALDRGVTEVNRRLAPPERIKAWAVLKGELSVARGDLTPNLKMRRDVIVRRYEAVVEALYGGDAVPSCVCHVGRCAQESRA